MDRLLIELTELNYPKLIHERDGNITENIITLGQLLDALQQTMREREDVILQTPLLPRGTLLYQQTSLGERVVMVVEPMVAPVRLGKAVIENVHFPRLIFSFSIRQNRVVMVRLVAVKDREINENTPLYRYPYSNVYEDTHVCWSELPIQIQQMSELSRIPYRWFGSENTFCLYGNNNLSGLEYRAYLESNQSDKREGFNEDTLMPLNLTFGEWMNR